MKNVWNALKFMALFGVLAFTVSCDDDDDTQIKTITETAVDADQFSTLVAALQKTGLDQTLQSGTYTVFAPTNQAFTDAGITDLDAFTDTELTNILLYHVIGANIASTDLADGDTYASSASPTGPNGAQTSLYINKNNGTVTVNGNATVTSADIEASNGVIHQINRVLLPLDVVGHASANTGTFSSLVGALTNATEDLVGALQGTGPFTVLAPTNAAFEAAAATIATLSAEQVTEVLKYHVASGNNISSLLTNGQAVMTLNGSEFTVNKNGNEVTITDAGGNTATVILADVQATNGVIHVIDQVIVPTL